MPDFEEWKEEVVNHLEDAGIAYSRQLDDRLFELWRDKLKPYQIPDRLRRSYPGETT